MLFSNPFKKKEVNYEELDGAAEEAARAALKGEVRHFPVHGLMTFSLEYYSMTGHQTTDGGGRGVIYLKHSC